MILTWIRYNLYRRRYTGAVNKNNKFPIDLSIELAGVCNSACQYCYWNKPKEIPFKPGMMKRDLAYKIIEEGAELGVHSFKTNFRGESTLNPIFEDVTAHAKRLSRGMTYMDRITNSNFQFNENREDIFRGLCNQTKVKVSFDSFIKEIFETQRFGSKYERTIKNIDKFYNYPGRKNELVIQSVRTMQNKDEDLEHEIKRRWPSATASIRDVVGGRVSGDLSDVIVKERDFANRQPCVQAFARLMVRWDGKVGACCPDIKGEIVLGDSKIQHLREIWNSTEAYNLRMELKNKTAFERDPCKTCSSFESYSGYTAPWNS